MSLLQLHPMANYIFDALAVYDAVDAILAISSETTPKTHGFGGEYFCLIKPLRLTATK